MSTANDAQRRIRRNPWLFTAPLVLLSVLVVVLVWEVVRGNLPEAWRAGWPWRLQLMSQEPLASLLAVAAGAVLARAQYARTVRPVLGWRSAFVPGELAGSERSWRVGILNGGQHNVALDRVDYRVVLAGGPDGEPAPGAGWSDLAGVADRLTRAGLRAGVDMRIPTFGPGFPLVATGTYETIEVGVFSKRFADVVQAFHVRIQVEDSVGDTHERVIDCLKGIRQALAAPVEWDVPAQRGSQDSQEPAQGV